MEVGVNQVSNFRPFFEVILNRRGIQQDVDLKSRLANVSLLTLSLVISKFDQLHFVNITEAVKYSPFANIFEKFLYNALHHL